MPTLILQPDAAAGKDCRIYVEKPTWNAGILNEIVAGCFGVNNIQHTLIEFDISSIAGTITAATLAICISNVTYSYASTTIDLYEIAAANETWIEGTRGAGIALAGEPCWNAKEADGAGGVTTAWAGSVGCSTAGTDWINTKIGTLTVPNPVVLNGSFSTALTAAVVNGWRTSNPGMFMRSTSEAVSNGAHMHSSDAVTAANRPMLTVIWSTAQGKVFANTFGSSFRGAFG